MWFAPAFCHLQAGVREHHWARVSEFADEDVHVEEQLGYLAYLLVDFVCDFRNRLTEFAGVWTSDSSRATARSMPVRSP